MGEGIGYHGPPRDPESVIRAAFSKPDLMRQLVASYEEERGGVPPIPWREIDEQLGQRAHRRRTAS